jgi:hypothetical protein
MKPNRELTVAVVVVEVVDAVEVAGEAEAGEKDEAAGSVSRLWYLYEAEFPGNKHLGKCGIHR